MSVLNPNSDDEPQECPLCMEFLELDDINFYPCSCGYQICRFCWNRLRTEGHESGGGLCPACRAPYAENPADFKPLTQEELAKIKSEKRQKDLAKKQRISENRKHLANVRVVQRNLVFVVGLSPRLADPEVLKKTEYFGRFGKIHKVVINTSTTYAGNQNQGPSASAYVTYYKSEDALRAIQAVNNVVADGRTLKASLGTTKYCSHFMKNMPCPKHDCMYLHELGDEAASFTKEEMQQGKHTEYEKNLHDELSMSSTTTVHGGPHPGGSSGVPGGVSNSVPGSDGGPSASMITAGSATYSSPSAVGGGSNLAPAGTSSGSSMSTSSTVASVVANSTAVGSSTGTTPNGRAASEHSDKIPSSTSRTPSPHHSHMADGGWPNLGMDNNSRSRTFDHQRNKSPSMSNNLDSMQSVVDNRTSLMNGGIADDILQQHRGRGPPGHPPGGPPSPPQPLLQQQQQQQQQQHTINEITNKHQVCDSDWGLPQGGGGSSPPGLPHHSNSTSIKDSYKQPEMSMPPISAALPADLFEEDDLGFDPFHETQKALAEMLESESKVQAELQKQLEQRQQQQIQQQQQQNHNQAQQQPHRHLYQHQASTGQIPNFPNSQNQRLNDDNSPPLQQQLRHESPVMNRAPIGTSGGNGGGGGGGSSSLMAGLRGFSNDLVQQTSIAGGSGGLPNHMNSASNSTAGGPPGLRKQPPPGFDPLSMLNSGSSNGQHGSQRNLLSPDMGLLNLETLTSQLNMNAGFGAGGHHTNDLGGQTSGGQSRHDSGQTGPGNGFGSHSGLLSNHHLHNGLGGPQNPGLGSLGLKNENSSGPGGMPGQHNRPQPFLLEKQQQQQNLSKDWQDGLRALLPNVNVSFGALPHGPGQAQNGTAPADHPGHSAAGQQRMYSQQSMMNHEHHHHSQHERQMQRHQQHQHQQQQQQQQQHQQHQHQQSRSGWNSVKSPHTNDWTTLDPAIVDGQVANNLSHNAGTGNNGTGSGGLRSESPPGWLKNNLDQLTGDSSGMAGGRFGGLNGTGSGAASGLISGLTGLGLGQGQPPIGQWGQPSPVMSNTPPPGFAMNRGQMGGHGQIQPPQAGGSHHQQPHPFSALGLGGGNGNGASDRDPTLESELARLVRS